MSNRIIDEQIVKMEFDNAKFEQNAQASLRTIDKLKAALKFENADKGFTKIEQAANSINLSKLDRNIQSIADRFSTMGIIGDQILRNLTNSVMGAFGKLNRLLQAPIQQMINGGKARAMNIANAQFSLKGLGIDWKQESKDYVITLKHMSDEEQAALKKSGEFVDSLYKDIDYAVSGTAYGLDEAAKAASILATSNVAIGDEMRTALRAISGVSAMTNRSYTEISNIFTHVAGKNKLQTEELNMLAERGLGAASKLAEYMGVSETAIKEMVSKGQIDFKTFAAAMDDAFGEHAKAANDTFNGALSNMKAALSRIGADVAGTAFDQMIKPMNQIRQIIDNIRVALQPFIKDVNYAIERTSQVFSEFLKMTGLVTDTKLTVDQMPRLVKVIENLEWAFLNVAYAIARFVKPFREALVEVFQPSGNIFVEISEAIRRFTEKLIISDSVQKALYNTFKAVFKVLKAGFKIIGSILKVVTKVIDVISPLISILAIIIEAIADIILHMLDCVDVADILNGVITGLASVIELIINVIAGLVGGIIMLVVSIGKWIAQMNILTPIMTGFNNTLKLLTTIGKTVTDTVSGFFGLFKTHTKDVKEASEATEEMSGVLGERLGPELSREEEGFEKAGEAATEYKNIFERVAEAIGNSIKWVSGQVDKFYEGSNPVGRNWLDAIKNFNLKSIIDGAEMVVDYVSKIDLSFEGISKAIVDAYNHFVDFLGMGEKKVDWNRVFKIAQATGLLAVASTGLSLAKKTANVANGMVKAINKIAEGVNKYLSAEAFAKRVSAFKDICKGILMIAAAIFLVGLIREDRLKQSVIAIGALVVAGAALMEAIKFIDKKFLPATDGGAHVIDKILGNLKKIASALAMSFTITGIGTSILMISAAIWLLAGAFVSWSNILSNPDIKVQETVLMMGGIMLGIMALIGICGVASTIAPALGVVMFGLAATIMSVVIAIYALIGAVWIFNNINWKEYQQGLEAVGLGIAGLLTAAIAALQFSGFGTTAGGVGLVLIGLAAGLYVLAYACKTIGALDLDSITKGFWAMTGFLIDLVGAMWALQATGVFSNTKSMGQWLGLAFTIMSLAYACTECVRAIETLTKLDPFNAFLAWIEVLTILAMIGKSMNTIGKATPDAGPILAFAILIGAISAALSWIALYDWPDIAKALVYLGISLGLACAVFKCVPPNMKAGGLLAMAAVIISVAGALSLLSKMSIPGIAVAIVELGAAIFVIGQVIKKVTGFSANWRAMLSFAALIVAVGGMMALLANFSGKRVLAAALAMSAVVSVVAGALIAISKFGSRNINIADNIKLIVPMLSMIAVAAGAIALLANMPNTDKALTAAVSLTLVLGAIVGVYAALELIPQNYDASLTVLVGIAAVVVAAGFAISALVESCENITDALLAAASLTLLLGSLVGVYAALNLIPANQQVALDKLGVAALVIAACGGVIYALSEYVTDADTAIKSALAMTILVGDIIALYAALSLIPNSSALNKTKAGLTGISTGIIVVLAGIVWGLSKIENPENAIKAAEALTVLAVVLVGLVTAMTILAAVATAAKITEAAFGIVIEAIAIAAAIITVLAALAWVLGEYMTEEAAKNIEKGFDRMSMIAEKFSSFLASFGSGYVKTFSETAADSVASSIKRIAAAIVEMVDALKPALDSLAEYKDTGAADSLNKIGKTIVALSASGLFNSGIVAGILGVNYDELIGKFKTLAIALIAFSNTVKGVDFDEKAIEDSKVAAGALIDLIKVMGEWTELEQTLKLFDTNTTTLGANLVNFGNALVKYNDTVADCKWDTEATGNAKSVADDIVEISNNLNPIHDAFTEYSNIGDLADNLGKFTTAICDYATKVAEADWDDAALDSAGRTVTSIAELSQSLQTYGGLKGLIMGDKETISKFGERLYNLGYYLKQFSDVVADINSAKCTIATSVIDMIRDSLLKIAESNGDFGNIRDFRVQMLYLADDLVTFNEKANGLKSVQITAACIAFEKIIAVFNEITATGDMSAAVQDFSDAVEKLGSVSFDKFIEAYSGTDVAGKVQGAVKKMLSYLSTGDVSKELDKMYQLGQKFVGKFIDGMGSETALEKIHTGMGKVLAAIENNLTAKSESGSEAGLLDQTGVDMLKAIADGFASETAITYLTDKIESTITSGLGQGYLDLVSLSTFTTLANNIIAAVADGINTQSNASSIATAIQSVVDSAVSSISVNIGIDVNTAVSGTVSTNIAEGVASGIQNGAKYVAYTQTKSSKQVSANGIAAFKEYDVSQNKAAKESMAAEEKRAMLREDLIASHALGVQNAFQKGSKDTAKKSEAETNEWLARLNATATGIGEAISNAGGVIGGAVADGYEQFSGNTQEYQDKIMEELTGKQKEAQEETQKNQEETQKAIEEAGANMGDALKSAGGKAAGGAKAGGDEFIASYSDFWQNLYAVHSMGMQGFEQQYESFETWQENTLKKTQDILEKYNTAITDAKQQAAEGLFSEVAEPKEDVTKEKLRANLQGQVDQIKEFNNIILQLRTRLMGTNLFDAITEMGVDSIDELRALNTMTDTELSEYANLYDQKYLASFQGIREKAQSELQNLYGGMAVNIDQFSAVFDGSLQSIEGYFASEAVQQQAALAGMNLTKGIANGITNEEAMASLNEAAEKINSDFVNMETGSLGPTLGESSPSKYTVPIGEYLTLGVAKGMTDETAIAGLNKSAVLLMSNIMTALDTAYTDNSMPEKLATFGNKVTATFANAITTANTMTADSVENGNGNVYTAGSHVMDNFLTGMQAKPESVATKVTAVMTKVNSSMKSESNTNKFKTSGTDLFKAVLNGFNLAWTGGKGEGNNSNSTGGYGAKVISSLMTKVIKCLKDYKGGSDSKKSLTFYKTGQELIKGLIAGLKSKQSELYKAIETIIKKALETANRAAQVASPSKISTETGAYIGKGYIVGLESMASAVSAASSSVAEEAISGFRDIMSILGGMDDIDPTPVIAPVMDLTGIQNGISDMSGLLKNNNAYEISASLAGNIDAQRLAKLNEMTEMRRAMDSVYSSNANRISEMAQLQSAVNQLNSLISSQTNPDYTSLQNSINALNSAINNQRIPDYADLQTSINGLNSTIGNTQTGNTLNVNPTFNIQSNDPEAVAEEVNIAIQNMIDRRSAVWGL